MGFCYYCMNQLEREAAVCPFCKSTMPYIPMHPEDLPPGTRLDEGRFVVGRALGHGGYGITYIAYDTKMQVRRTIKEYYPRGAVRDENMVPVYPESEEANVERTRQHFLHEARMMIKASEGHIPGIVQGIDTFSENGTTYLLMEYLDGYTLDDHMQRVGPFQWKKAVRYVADALGSLQKLHEKNILHRDISCNNIFLCSDNTIRLIDFGSAEPLDRARTDPGSLWRSRKPAYTPREQAENRPQGPWSDIYAMGVVLFKMITGGVDRQLNGKTLPSVRSVVRNDQSIPAALDVILKTATAEDPEKRFKSADEFRRKLLALIGEKPKKGHTGLLIALASLLAAIVLIVVLTSGGNEEDTWSTVELSEASAADATLRYGELYTISGTGQPNEGVRMILVKDGSEEELIADEQLADARGRWELQYNTALADVEQNNTAGYVIYVAYQAEDHRNRSAEVRLTVDRTLLPLTIGFSGQNSANREVTVGEPVLITGTGEKGQIVKVTAGDAEWTAEWQGDTWQYEIDTTELAPGISQLTREVTIQAYYDGMRHRTLTGKELNLVVRKSLQPISLSFEDGTESTTVLEINETVKVHGTASAGEIIILMTGAGRPQRIPVQSDGTWEATLPKVNNLGEYVFNERVEIPVYAYYSVDENSKSGEITLISNVGSDEAPAIEAARLQLKEGEAVTLGGTAEAGAKLQMEIRKGGKVLTAAKTGTITCGQDGRWTVSISSEDIPDERPEGKWTAYELSVSQQKGEKKLASNTVEISIFRDKSLKIPTILFSGKEGMEQTVRYSDRVELAGTATAGEHLNLLMNGAAQAADVLVDGDGNWNYTLSIPESYIPELDQTTELKLQVKYVSSGEASEEATLKVNNPRFIVLGLSFVNGSSIIAGGNEQVTLAAAGEAGEQISVIRNGSVWKNGTLDEEGIWAISMTGSEMTSGADEAVFYALYVRQAENRSEEVKLTLDLNAEIIEVSGAINEESTEIRGTGEPGAEILLKIDDAEIATARVQADGSFSFTGLRLSAGQWINLVETDAYGNKSPWNGRVAETVRAEIILDQYANGDYLTYGPSGNKMTISGTATANKTILLRKNSKADQTSRDTTSVANGEGRWSADLTLELTDKQQTDLVIRYEDGRGTDVVLHAVCDNAVDAPVLQDDVIYESTPDVLAYAVGEANCKVRWKLKDASGKVKKEGTDRPDGLRSEIPLPAGRAAGDTLEIVVTDAYGNESSASIKVQQQRDEVSGKIASVLVNGEKDLKSGGTFSGTLQIEAYVVAGGEATGSPALQMVQGGNVLGRTKLNQVSGDDLKSVASKFPDRQADLGWKIKNGNLAMEGIKDGDCELRLMMGNTVIESWPLKYSESEAGTGPVMHVYDPAEGYDIGMDTPSGSFRAKSIYLTGWIYSLYEDSTQTIMSGLLNIYEDAACTVRLKDVSASNKDQRGRMPSTTQCDADVKSLSGAAVSKAGWVLNFQVGGLAPGTYWAKLEVRSEVFGPFRLIIDENAPQFRMSDYVKNLNWGTEE